MTRTAAPKVKTPTTLQAATDTAERFAALTAEMQAVEANRNAAIAATNAVADTLAAPLIAELDAIEAALQPWWDKHGANLTKGKRKSIELGGCMVGTVAGRATLAIADEAAAKTTLQAARWAKPYLRTTVLIDKATVFQALTGPHAERLAKAGFSKAAGKVTFFIERAEQQGTAAAA